MLIENFEESFAIQGLSFFGSRVSDVGLRAYCSALPDARCRSTGGPHTSLSGP